MFLEPPQLEIITIIFRSEHSAALIVPHHHNNICSISSANSVQQSSDVTIPLPSLLLPPIGNEVVAVDFPFHMLHLCCFVNITSGRITVSLHQTPSIFCTVIFSLGLRSRIHRNHFTFTEIISLEDNPLSPSTLVFPNAPRLLHNYFTFTDRHPADSAGIHFAISIPISL